MFWFACRGRIINSDRLHHRHAGTSVCLGIEFEFTEGNNEHIADDIHHYNRTRALVQWLKLPAWKVGDQGFEVLYSKFEEKNVSSRLTRK